MPEKRIFTCIVCGEEFGSTVLKKKYEFDNPVPVVEFEISLRTRVYQRVPSTSEPHQWEDEWVCETCALKVLNEGE